MALEIRNVPKKNNEQRTGVWAGSVCFFRVKTAMDRQWVACRAACSNASAIHHPSETPRVASSFSLHKDTHQNTRTDGNLSNAILQYLY